MGEEHIDDKAEIQRLVSVLQTLIRILDLPNREIERRLGLSPSYLTRIFNGYVEVRLEHILSISRAIGLKPGEFFEFAYPQPPEEPSASAREIRGVLAHIQPARPAPPKSATPLTEQEIDRLLEEKLQKFLATQEKKRAAGGE